MYLSFFCSSIEDSETFASNKTDNVTYICEPGKLFAEGSRQKDFMCKDIDDWDEISALQCVGGYIIRTRILHLCRLPKGRKKLNKQYKLDMANENPMPI